MWRVSLRFCDLPSEKMASTVCRLLRFWLLNGSHRRFVGAHGFVRSANHSNRAAIHPHDAIAQPPHLVHLMRHEHHSPARSRHVSHLPETLFLKIDVAD